jgi:type IV pilus assembly protein PilA
MKNKQSGFSLIELLLVVVIIGIIAAIAVPSLMKARESAENGSAFSAMRTLSTLQVGFYSQNNRYGRLDEILANQQTRLGTYAANTLTRGKFRFQMSPVAPTDAQLQTQYTIVATRAITGSETPYMLKITQEGTIEQIFAP